MTDWKYNSLHSQYYTPGSGSDPGGGGGPLPWQNEICKDSLSCLKSLFSTYKYPPSEQQSQSRGD